jgi:two-component system chemotaxis response regulator CheB
MGRDGAAGLKAMKAAGARTLGQDEASCVVYGMPKAAFEIGALDRQLPIGGIGPAILGLTERKR